MIVFHLSNLKNSTIAINGECIVHYDQQSFKNQELLLQALEINRKLIAAISREWESESQCIVALDNLIQESRNLELTFSSLLKNSSL
jgi:hypothetical protein